MRKLTLEEGPRGHEVQDAKFNTLGRIVQVARHNKKRWIFKGGTLYEYTPSQLRQIAKLMEGMKG